MPLVAHAPVGGSMKLESRNSFGWPATAAPYAPCKNGLVVHYDGSNQGLAGKSHDACRSYWRNTRGFHMGPARGWLDIGYSFAVCPHGVALEGRGWQRQQAAQPGGNSSWTSVTFMSGDTEPPTGAQVEAFRQLRAWLRGKGLGAAIKGHRDFISTSCPGSILYGMVKSGALISGDIEEDDMKVTDSVPVGKTYDKDFAHDSYPASYVWIGAYAEAKRTSAATARLEAAVAKLAQSTGVQVDVDEDAIVQGVLAGLTPAGIASAVVAALPADLAQQVVDEIQGRLAE